MRIHFRSILRNYISKLLLGLTEKILNRYNFQIISVKDLGHSEVIIDNYFKTDLKKNALISYLVSPFLQGINNSHSNSQECYAVAEILRVNGYNVDIINWDNNSFLPRKNYDLIFDNHNNLYRLKDYIKNDCIKIFHATNCHWLFQNAIEYSRASEYFHKSGKVYIPSRILTPGNSVNNSDYITMFGNRFTSETYGKFQNKIYKLPISSTSKLRSKENRDHSLSKKNFIWLNSHGFLLKGLDILIDAFSKLPDLNLFICADLKRENNFIELSANNFSNIHKVGWVDINSAEFEILSLNCSWVISTSFSEGGGGSIINSMAKGLIPVITHSVSIDLPPNTGFYLENNDTDTLITVLKSIVDSPNEILITMSQNAYDYVKENHSLDSFKSRFQSFLNDINV